MVYCPPISNGDKLLDYIRESYNSAHDNSINTSTRDFKKRHR